MGYRVVENSSALKGCPSPSELASVLDGADEFTIAVRGFSCVEAVVNALLEEALPQVDALDLERLTVNLKLNLAVALRAVEHDEVQAVLALSKIRNRFAHDFRAVITPQSVPDLINVMSARQRQMYDKLEKVDGHGPSSLWRIVLVIWQSLVWSVELHRRSKHASEAYEELFLEDLRKLSRGGKITSEHEIEGEIARRVDEKLRAKAEQSGRAGDAPNNSLEPKPLRGSA